MTSKTEESDAVQSALDYLNAKTGYKCGTILGKGTYGSVVQVNKNGSHFAVKIIERKLVNQMEVVVWPKLDHVNILKLVETLTDLERVVLFVTDLMATNLFLRLQDKEFKADPKALEKCQKYSRQVFSGLSHLHRHQLCHLDLRAENVFLSADDDRAVIADFSGLSWSGTMRSFCPLPHSLRPPEMLTSKKCVHPIPIDLWSCGLLLANMFLGKGFYICTVKHARAGHIDVVHQYSRLFQDAVYIRKFVGETYPCGSLNETSLKDLISLIHRFLRINPKSRLSVKDALKHPFLKGSSGVPDATLQEKEQKLKIEEKSDRFQATISRSDAIKSGELPKKDNAKGSSRWSRYKLKRLWKFRSVPSISMNLFSRKTRGRE